MGKGMFDSLCHDEEKYTRVNYALKPILSFSVIFLITRHGFPAAKTPDGML